jgi:hypothetical protein
MLKRLINGEIALGFLSATVFWICVLGWQAANAPTEKEKQECYEAAKKSGHKTEDCKTFWERTTSDPIAFYTLGTFIFTAVIGAATGLLWSVTRISSIAALRQADVMVAVESPFPLIAQVKLVQFVVIPGETVVADP